MNDDNPWLVLAANLAGLCLVIAQTDQTPPMRHLWYRVHRGSYKLARLTNRIGLWAEARYWGSQ